MTRVSMHDERALHNVVELFFLEAKIDVLRGTIVATCVYFDNIFLTSGITSR